jgi:hypothetical protein
MGARCGSDVASCHLWLTKSMSSMK